MARGKRPQFDALSAFLSPQTQQSLSGMTPLPLDSIRPDPEQPRRLLPPDLAHSVAEGEMTPVAAINAWRDRVEQRDSKAVGVEPLFRQNWQELCRLAESIAQHGLINPITVRPAGRSGAAPAEVDHLIVTGERRYWAQTLLTSLGRQINEGSRQVEPDHIKALIAPEGISVRAHQMIENVQREDINAVEKASGLLALRYELSEVPHGSPSTTAAVDEGDLLPWARVEEAVGLSKRHRIRLTKILELSAGALALAAEQNLTERALRPIVSRLRDYPGLQLQALTQLVAWQQASEAGDGPELPVATMLERLVDQLLQQQEDAGRPAEDEAAQRARQAAARRRQLQKRVRGTLRLLNGIDDVELADLAQALQGKEREQVITNMRRLHERLEVVLTALEPGQDG